MLQGNILVTGGALRGNVLITGGAGFIGRAIMRRAREQKWNATFTVYSRSEHLQVETRRRFPEARYILGDVVDYPHVSAVMMGHDYVIHAAALKFIPEGEFNASEVVRVNIMGAQSVVEAARDAGVRMVGISTDKAAAPTNIYGASKMVMERLFAQAGFNTVRYGNVLGSTGSVVPMMKRQLIEEGVISVTDPYMTRFWMRADAAVDTILAAFDAPEGTTTIPHPRSANMHAVAHAVIEDESCAWGAENVGMRPCHRAIKYVGIRPGEKLHEELITEYESARASMGQGYFTLYPPGDARHTPTRNELQLSSHTALRLDHDVLIDMIHDAESV